MRRTLINAGFYCGLALAGTGCAMLGLPAGLIAAGALLVFLTTILALHGALTDADDAV